MGEELILGYEFTNFMVKLIASECHYLTRLASFYLSTNFVWFDSFRATVVIDFLQQKEQLHLTTKSGILRLFYLQLVSTKL
jgi:hypothetical protein